MKPSIVVLLIIVVAACTACAAEPTVIEERMPGGISVISHIRGWPRAGLVPD